MDGLDILHRGPRHTLDVLLVAVGPLAAPALEAARALERQDVGTTVVDPRWLLPVHEALPAQAARQRSAPRLGWGRPRRRRAGRPPWPPRWSPSACPALSSPRFARRAVGRGPGPPRHPGHPAACARPAARHLTRSPRLLHTHRGMQ
ncbi:transketolase C-terminal domain-containing protein [Streptomyces nondiastaticus]|uniref:transketolase C-terminal domain-containing protein n=1 Tax=Streptomyces nondiastaticus TaxID=3154512 RepID=UPI003417F659